MSKKIEEIKKTAEAHGTVSEELAEKALEKATEEMIKKEQEKEKKAEEEKKKEAIKKIEKEEEPETEEERVRRRQRGRMTREEITSEWEPKTKLGREVKDGKVKSIDEILDSNKKILESEIVDTLLDIKSDLISIGQSKGKFGGGKRRAWRQTQRKTREGNVPTFSTLAVIGDENGHVGIGTGRATETLPARDKAIHQAKLNIISVTRGCASFDCDCSELHTVPFKVTGKSGSVEIALIPAPQGTGLVVANEIKKVLKMAGIKDVYSKSFGKQRTTFNFVKACIDALKKTNLPVGGKKE